MQQRRLNRLFPCSDSIYPAEPVIIGDHNFCFILYYRCLMAQFVYTMNRVGKVVPPKREILKNISLSFFPGAKIGVLGLNGSGKSTLLKIMAGVDQEYPVLAFLYTIHCTILFNPIFTYQHQSITQVHYS